MMTNLIYLFLLNLITMIGGMNIPCVNFDEKCYGRTCCEPYICYEETVCIGMNITQT